MKKKIFIIAVAVCLAVLSIAGSSIAYFTDTEEYTNTFTAGNVDIKLTYKGVETNDGVEVDDVIELADTHVYPGQTYPINAVITNIGSEKAYVGAIITLTDDADITAIVGVNGGTDNYPVAIRKFLDGLADDGFTVKTAVSTDNKVLTIYVVKEVALDENGGSTTTCTLFNNVVIPKEWDNDEMKAFNGFKLNVTAYATQIVGFAEENNLNEAEVAITTAFAGTAWDNYAGASVLP